MLPSQRLRQILGGNMWQSMTLRCYGRYGVILNIYMIEPLTYNRKFRITDRQPEQLHFLNIKRPGVT